ncbi:MAG: hypothetical protein Q4D98_09435 [Planctomycetia bacterium]|nr:hypothetical protein [Planctomycetia bacterium]
MKKLCGFLMIFLVGSVVLGQEYAPEAPIVPSAEGKGARPLQAPFVLTPEQQVQTDAVLKRWEQFSTAIRTFESKFTRMLYVVSFQKAGELERKVETGELRYESPDKGMFSVNDASDDPVEKWLCDGKNVFEYKFQQKQIDQHVLPPQMQGKGITSGPLPFLFGASMEELKRRYYIRLSQPATGQQRPGQVWIEAFPKTAEDSVEFQRAEMIITFVPEVRPLAIKLHKANKEQHVYVFDLKNMKVNKTQWLPANWAPTLGEKMKMKLVPVEE